MAAVNMTEGRIPKQLIRYSVPLILGNFFQLTYNVVDSMIVGQFIGKETLAAVGTASPVMNMMILGISGICIGASVLMSRFFGAGDAEKVKKEMATTAVSGFVFSMLLAVVGILLATPLLRLIRVPSEILGLTTVYLRLVFLGLPFTFLYNAYAAALKAIGDSKTPLKYLAFASVLNAVLDLILIGGLRLGVVCSALTTVVAQLVSVLLCIRYVYQKVPQLSLGRAELWVEKELLRQTLQYGMVTALQQACQPIGKLFIQSGINTLGVDGIAAFHAVGRIDDYAFTPEQNIANAMTTFIAQNKGAGKKERMRQGARIGMGLELIYGVFIGLVVYIFREPLVSLFVEESSPGVIAVGSSYLAHMAFFYIIPSVTNGVQGCFRGLGWMKMTLLGTFLQISVRAVMIYVLVPEIGMNGAAYACVAGWAVMMLVQIPCLVFAWRKEKTIPKKN
ncbi:MAG: MATE family efflux transporter [Lachnospiraceae bacterium]|nr:MATE family efflux transporter [Lachnospiraceae bacterium]